MHAESLELMREALEQVPDHPNRPLQVLDVGAYDVNGTYRPLVERRGWRYTGLDIRPGPNVDLIVDDEWLRDAPLGFYDVVVCGNMLHNVRWPWVLVRSMAERLRFGGLLIVVAPWLLDPGRAYPLDTLRFLPDGVRALFQYAALLTELDIRLSTRDVIGIAKRGHS